MGLWYSKDSRFELIAYADADHAGCNDDCKSTSRGIQFLGDKLVSWSSKSKNCTAFHIAEANYALTATADVPAVYLQQFWRTVSKVPDTEETIKFLLDFEQFIYTVDMFRDTLNLPVETLENPFVAPANIHTIEAFMNRVFYQGVVDKKFPNIPKRIEEDYHSIKDDVPLVSVYITGNVLVRGMLILDALLTAEVRETDDLKEYDTVFMKVAIPMNQPQPVVSTQGTNRNIPRAHRSPTVSANPLETKKRKQTAGESSSLRKSLKITIKQRQIVKNKDVDSEDRIERGSHKENPKIVDDDDDKAEEKQSDDMGSLEIRNEETQTTIPTPPSSPRKILSWDKKIDQELMDIVSIPTISNKYSHLPGALHRMCRRQGYMIQDMERKCVTTTKFWETHNKIDDILHKIVSQIAKNVTNDLIEYNLKPCIANTIIEDRDTFRSEVLALVSQEFNAHAPVIIEELFKSYVQSNVVHVHPTTTTSIETDSLATLQYQLYLNLKRREKRVKRSKGSKRSKSARGSLSKHSSKDSTKYVSKQQSQQQEWDAWEEENVIDEDEVIPEDETPKLIAEFQNVDKRVPTIFNHGRIEATLKDTLSNQFRNAEEYAYHLEQSTNFMENQIYGNTEEMKYILSLHKIHAEEFLEPDLEEELN
ncbi:hypothetical protein Tco_0696004 [Tanacetum coccineum]